MRQPDTSLHLVDTAISFDGRYLDEIRSSYLSEGTEVLAQRLIDDGYLCMRELIPREAVLKARQVMYQQLADDDALADDSTFDCPRGEARSYMGQKQVTHHTDFLAAVEHQRAFDFFNALFAEPALTFDYKWARVVPEGAAGTQAHLDVVYMGRGSDRLHTMWVPLGDVPVENGPMAILSESHRHPAMKRIHDTYGGIDVDRDGVQGGWFTNDPIELSELTGTPWLTGDFAAGDVVIMGTHFMHASMRNELNQLRFTVDVRFQPAADPVDDRWVGEKPIAHKVWWDKEQAGETVSMASLREQWQV